MVVSNRERLDRSASVTHSGVTGVALRAALASVVTLVLLAPSAGAQQGQGAGVAEARPPRVTPTTGPSWLEVRRTSMETSAMGRVGRQARTVPDWVPTHAMSELERLDRPEPPEVTERFTITGADLFRLSCRSCHSADGTGSPPEVKSLIDPIRATSAELTLRQMEERGRPIGEDFARTLADQAKQTFLDRLEHGGERMPIYNHLADDEIDALYGYLLRLARVPGAPEKDVRLERSVTRVGELLVKGTCHTCHAAAGRGGGIEVLARGTIPSLDTIPEQKLVGFVLQKVRKGAPIDPSWGARGRMPVFSYLTEDEVRAAYLYLVLYPPQGR